MRCDHCFQVSDGSELRSWHRSLESLPVSSFSAVVHEKRSSSLCFIINYCTISTKSKPVNSDFLVAKIRYTLSVQISLVGQPCLSLQWQLVGNNTIEHLMHLGGSENKTSAFDAEGFTIRNLGWNRTSQQVPSTDTSSLP
jgi:hypothetical protein